MFAHTTTEDSPSKAIHYAWIGPPTQHNPKSIAGHDIAGPIEMARQLERQGEKTNPIKFWCLQEHEKYYQEVFAREKVDIEVCVVEKLLDQEAEDEAKAGMIKVLQKMLDDIKAEPDDISLRVGFKDGFSLFLLFCQGGYFLDTSILPVSGKTVSLPGEHYFFTGDNGGFLEKTGKNDFHLMYSPSPHDPHLHQIIDEWKMKPELGRVSAFIYPCNIVHLIAINEGENIDENIYEEARKKRIPILIKEGNRFKVYGDREGNGNWTLSNIDANRGGDIALMMLEPWFSRRIEGFPSGRILKYGDKGFDSSMARTIVQPGHQSNIPTISHKEQQDEMGISKSSFRSYEQSSGGMFLSSNGEVKRIHLHGFDRAYCKAQGLFYWLEMNRIDKAIPLANYLGYGDINQQVSCPYSWKLWSEEPLSHIVNIDACTLLHQAVLTEQLDQVECLIAAGARLDLAARYQLRPEGEELIVTPLELAEFLKQENMVDVLRRAAGIEGKEREKRKKKVESKPNQTPLPATLPARISSSAASLYGKSTLKDKEKGAKMIVKKRGGTIYKK